MHHSTCTWGDSPRCAVIYKIPKLCLPIPNHISCYVTTFHNLGFFIHHRTCAWGNSPKCSVIYKSAKLCLPIIECCYKLVHNLVHLYNTGPEQGDTAPVALYYIRLPNHVYHYRFAWYPWYFPNIIL